MMSDVILDEAGFDSGDISIAVTDRDKDNLLISLLAAKNRDAQAVSLVNSRDYTVLAANIRNNVIVDRAVITISGILKYLRKARIEEAYAIGRDLGEIWEIRLGEDSSNIGKSIAELNIPTESSVMLILSGDRLIYDFKTYRLTAQDKIIIYVTPSDIRRIEKIFYL
jgi:Trk K+ transport system NAD-binding subunit